MKIRGGQTAQQPLDSEYNKKTSLLEPTPGTLERVFAISVLLLGSGAFLVLIQSEGQYNQSGGGAVFEAVWGIIYIMTLFLLLFRVRGFASGFLKELPIVAFASIALVSTMWSDSPAISFRRSIALWLTVIFGYYLARRFSLREQLHLLAWVCGISIFFSFPFGLLHITRKGDVVVGAWNGIFGQKNVLGGMMALSVLVFLVLGRVEPQRRWRWRIGILAALVLLALSHSAGAVVVTALTFVLVQLAGTLRKRLGKALVIMTLAAITGMIVLFWVVTHFGAFTGALGKGETMSGRLQLWILCVVMALQKPWLGHGFGAFWLGMHGPSWRILLVLPSRFNSRAHNGFLQTWLDLGLIGVGLLVAIFVVYTIRAALLVRRTAQPEAIWPLMIMVFYFISSMTETLVPGVNSIAMIIFSSAIFGVSAPALQRAGIPPDQRLRRSRVVPERSGIESALPGTSSA